MSTTYTHKDLADSLAVSETTIKSYRRKFPGCIPVAHQGKPIRFTEEALKVCTQIRDNFSLGMSVEEVHARLAQNFSWVPELATKQEGKHHSESGPQEISQGMSNMAKSMVSMMQQQKLIAKKMQAIEAQLEELGLGGYNFDEAIAAREVANAKKEASFTDRLNQLDSLTGMLGETVTFLSQKLERLLEENHYEGKGETTSNKTIQFPGASSFHNRHASETVVEPEREFFTYPLVVRTSEGKYISAAARGRGRLSLNDLKAMLVYGYSSPHHFVMQWEQMNDGWQLTLSQPEVDESKRYILQLVELVTQGGTKVLEIVQLFDSQSNIHPVEICRIVESLTTPL